MRNAMMLYKHRDFSLEIPMENMASLKRTFFNCDISTQYHSWVYRTRFLSESDANETSADSVMRQKADTA